MNLLEHEAKRLLADAGIPVPSSHLVHKGTPHDLTTPLVLKSQVPTGGRGKAGGIKVVDDPAQLNEIVDQLFALPIKDHIPKTLLAEEKLAIKKEFYLSLLVDRGLKGIKLMAHINGGVEVEDNHDFKEWAITDQSADVLGQALADYYDLPDQTFALQDLLEKLQQCLKQNDALMIEINPLILTEQGKLIAGDAKMTLDDAAGFRHEWLFEATPAEANFVTINHDGDTATIANGAGLAMATVDAAFEAGLQPANFLDIGGGASTETLLKAFHRIMEYPNIQVILINIFAGITRADEVANAIVAARQQIANLPPLCIRLAGTNYQAAADILIKATIAIMPDIEACLKKAQEVIHD